MRHHLLRGFQRMLAITQLIHQESRHRHRRYHLPIKGTEKLDRRRVDYHPKQNKYLT